MAGSGLFVTGTDTDVVMSSRVRLARNVAGFPFALKASEEHVLLGILGLHGDENAKTQTSARLIGEHD